jgi:ADP-heptose:LPS heptosyltransferase
MKNVLVFRSDRVGDFLLTLSLIKIIKANYPDSRITVVASNKNFDYIKSFGVVNNVVLLKNNFLSKIKLTYKLRNTLYDLIVVHDGKNRSRLISWFLKYTKRVVCFTNLIDTQIEIIQRVCNKANLKFNINCLDFLDNRNHLLGITPFKRYTHLHFDEKWTHSEYIKKYVNIEPNVDELISFINQLTIKNKNIIITTGKNSSKLLNNIKPKINKENIMIYENQGLLEIENIVFNSDLLIACHGWISHIASAKSIRQIGIIDHSYPYSKWTSHFRNYKYLYRKSFSILSKEIIKSI